MVVQIPEMSTKTAQTDPFDKLVEDARTGNKEALGLIAEQLHERVVYYLMAQGANGHDAEEAAQNTWVKVALNIHKFKRQEPLGASFRGYVFRIAYREQMNLYRKRNGQAELPDHYEEAAPSPQFTLRAQERQDDQISLMKRCLEKLADKAKKIVSLRSVKNRAEVSEILGIPIGTIDSTFSRARAEVLDCVQRLTGADQE